MGNIVRCFNDELLDNIYINYMSPNSLRVKFTVDMDSLLNDKRKSLTFINAYFRLISALPFLNLEIYEAARSTANIVRMVQKGNIAAWGFELKNDVPDILFVVENEENVDESYQSLRAFDEKNQSYPCKKMLKMSFRTLERVAQCTYLLHAPSVSLL